MNFANLLHKGHERRRLFYTFTVFLMCTWPCIMTSHLVKKKYSSPYTKESLPGKNKAGKNCCSADFHSNFAIDLNCMGIFLLSKDK